MPSELTSLIVAFAALFSKPVWAYVQVCIVGALLAPAKRTVTSARRGMRLSAETHFQHYHRVLNRAMWSSLAASRRLLSLLLHRDYNGDVGDLSLVVYEDPNALIFKGKHKGTLHAKMCGDCGYTELCLESPQEFYKIYTEPK